MLQIKQNNDSHLIKYKFDLIKELAVVHHNKEC